jgi:hypothetical protein
MGLTTKKLDELAALPSSIFWSEDENRSLLEAAREQTAWNDCAETMPKGWEISGIARTSGIGRTGSTWRATARQGNQVVHGDGKTRTEALLALRHEFDAGFGR